METTNQNSENFSLSEGGPFHNALVKMRLSDKQGKLVLVVLCITWLTLVIITFIEGTLYSGIQLSFLKDVAMQARLLVALPILIMIKPAIDNKVVEVTMYLSETLMGPEERHEIITKAFFRAKKLTSSGLTEIVLLLIVIGMTISLVKGGVYSALEGGITSWMASTKTGNQSLSFAGDWAVFFSIPLFSFFLLRWLWRYLILILFPLVFFMGKLVKVKQQGLMQLSKLGATLSSKFEGEWVNDLPIEQRISEQHVDPSMVFDYSGIYDSVQQIRIIPVTIRDIIGMALALLFPFIPILFIHFSVSELLKKILGMLF
ncbi:MAG: hypothetical protein WCI71_13470 [Bacteroidota bacterium]